MTKKKITKASLSLAILMVYFTAGSGGSILPAINDIHKAFPNISYHILLTVTSLSNLMIVFASVGAGYIAGKRLRYRTLLLCSLGLYIIGGTLPFFIKNFIIILISRILSGIGIGLLTPLGNPLVFQLCTKADQPFMLGLGNSALSLGGVIIPLIAGFLCSFHWQYTFLVHLLLGIPFLVIFLFLPEPVKQSETGIVSKSNHLPAKVYFLSGIAMLFTMLVFPLTLNMSAIIVENHFGNAATAGILLSLSTLGGAIFGIFYGRLYQAFQWSLIPISFLLCAAGLLNVYFANGLLWLIGGILLFSMGSVLLSPTLMVKMQSEIPEAQIASASGSLMAFINLGGFLTSGYITLLSKAGFTDSRSPLVVSTGGLLLMVIVYVIYNAKGSGTSVR